MSFTINPYAFGGVAPPGPHPLAYLFSGGEEGAIYDPAYFDGTTYGAYTDVGGTTPATTDGQLVAYATDFSGNGNHLLQATSGFRPQYKISGGKAWLLSDGADDSMQSAGNVAGLKDFVVATRYGSANFISYDGLLCTFDSSADAIIFTGDFAAGTQWFSGAGNLTNFRLNGSASTAAPMNTDGVCSVEKTSGNSATTAPIRIFTDRNNPSRCWTGRLYGGLLIDRILTGPELLAVEAYMATRF